MSHQLREPEDMQSRGFFIGNSFKQFWSYFFKTGDFANLYGCALQHWVVSVTVSPQTWALHPLLGPLVCVPSWLNTCARQPGMESSI